MGGGDGGVLFSDAEGFVLFTFCFSRSDGVDGVNGIFGGLVMEAVIR